MAFPIKDFDPSIPAGSGVIDTHGVNKNEQLWLVNDSHYILQLTFADESIDYLPAECLKDFIKANVAMGKVSWQVFDTVSGAASFPMVHCYGILYEDGEHIPSGTASFIRG